MKIILGVGGGIAGYKAAELARLLMQENHEVQAVMTDAKINPVLRKEGSLAPYHV